ncbi:DUF3558 domain-containing protein [Amycolatopsis samaneae]|uniref:DUF3558 domain-containing protein n=1 Tax=Amycolatopsis samaneae TaxID=664691 RepID=A0ABW5GJ14_9PSEU
MNRNANALAAVLALALLSSSCSSTVEGHPTPAIGDSSVPDGKNAKAPAVPQPLNVTKYLADPCTSLTQAHYQRLGAKGPGERHDNADGNPDCAWRLGKLGDIQLDVTYFANVPEGLSRLYALKTSGYWEKGYFEPTSVDGYPAVYASIGDWRKDGDCQLNVGASDQLYFFVLVQARPGDDSCTAVRNVASAVLDTIKKGA